MLVSPLLSCKIQTILTAQLEFRDVLRKSEEAEAEVVRLRDQVQHVRKPALSVMLKLLFV